MVESLFKFLESIGYTHPVHPPSTHMVVGMAIGGFLFFMGSFFFRDSQFSRTSHRCFVMALLFMIPTVILGLLDWQRSFDGVITGLIQTKMILAATLSAFVIISVILGRQKVQNRLLLFIFYGGSALTSISLGYIGGILVYG